MKIVRFLVEVDAAWQVTITSEPAGADWRITRVLRKTTHGGRAFPFPPEAEMAAAQAECPICNDQDLAPLAETYERIIRRQPLGGPPSDIETFGRYLFLTLVGDANWQLILGAAKVAEAESMELALSWSANDQDLHRLNWEMMRGPGGFLAAGLREGGKVLPIGIVRTVASTQTVPIELKLPSRVLFVVHTDILDEKIRPAAEILGIIERLEREGRGFHRDVLRNASGQLLSARIKAFQPDVVYFVGHGGTEAGRGYLVFKDEEQKQNVKVYAEQIVTFLGAAAQTPPIVVLSACETGAAANEASVLLGAHAVAPLAAELVQRGVPIVVGMAGRVSDRACRLFTHSFGVGLLSGQPLLAAIAAGRCAAFSEGPPPHKTADWAFPAVFLSGGVPPDYIASKITVDDPSVRLAGWMYNLKLSRPPVFCAREEFFEAYNAMLGREERKIRPAILGIHVSKNLPGFGRTRLLQELAAQTLRDGHLPLFVGERQDGIIPDTCLALAIQILGAADGVCKLLAIPPVDPSQVLLLKKGENDVAKLQEHAQLDGWVKRELEKNGLSNTAIKLALQADLVQLGKAFRAKYPPTAGTKPRVVVLLNRVELYGDSLTTALLSEWADPAGLGTADEPVPLMLTFALDMAANHIFNRWIADAQSRPWILERALKPFAPGEDILAYQRVFMNPFLLQLLPGISDVPLAINDDADPKTIETWEKVFRATGNGMPSAFLMEQTFALAKVAVDQGYLVPIQDYKRFDEVFGK
jgi:hypothetical protein